MKKSKILIILSVLCVVLLAFSLTACNGFGNKGEQNEGDNSKSQDFVYTLKSDDTYELTECNKNFPRNDNDMFADVDNYVNQITIPSTYKDKPITSIAPSAFMNSSNVFEVILSKGMKELKEESLPSDLKKLTISSTVEIISPQCFGGQGFLANLVVDKDCKYDFANNITFSEMELFGVTCTLDKMKDFHADKITLLDGETITKDTFAYKEWFVEIVLPSSVKRIEDGAFQNKNINRIKLSEGLEYIGKDAFRGSSISKIVIPSTVKEIGTYAFAESDLTDIEVKCPLTNIPEGLCMGSRDLKHFVFDENTEFDMIGKFAFKETELTKFTASCKEIGEGAFDTLGYVEEPREFCIKGNITNIPKRAFACASFDKFIIPKTITAIGESAFESAGLKGFVIDETWPIKTIAKNAFYCAREIEKIVVNESINVLEEGVFLAADIDTLIVLNKDTEDFWDETSGLLIKNEALNGNFNNFYMTDIYKIDAKCDKFIINVKDYMVADHYFYTQCNTLIDAKEVKILPNSYGTEYTPIPFGWNVQIIELDYGFNSIAKEAFSSVPGLVALEVPESVDIIGKDIFYGNKNNVDIYTSHVARPSGWIIPHNANVHYSCNYDIERTYNLHISDDITKTFKKKGVFIIPKNGSDDIDIKGVAIKAWYKIPNFRDPHLEDYQKLPVKLLIGDKEVNDLYADAIVAKDISIEKEAEITLKGGQSDFFRFVCKDLNTEVWFDLEFVDNPQNFVIKYCGTYLEDQGNEIIDHKDGIISHLDTGHHGYVPTFKITNLEDTPITIKIRFDIKKIDKNEK